jgi:hypothetical protein
MHWRIYYADGSSLDGWGDASIVPTGRRFQVQIVVQEDRNHGRQLVHFADYYLWRSDIERWIGVAGDLSAMMALTQHTKEVTCLLWGSMMDPYGWAKVQARASTDSGFADKTAQRKFDAVRR